MQSLKQALREHYDLDPAQLQSLPGYEDQNQRLVTTDGRRFVAKLVHPDTSSGVLEGQDALLEHLAREAPRLSLPRLVRTRDGRPRAEVDGRRLRVLTWLEGRLMADVGPPSQALLGELGRFLGQLDQALAGFSHPALLREFDWDPGRLMSVCADLEALTDPDQRRSIEHLLLEFELTALADLTRLPRGVVHNDANDHNVLIRADDRIGGLIDFGDVVVTARVNELAVAVAYAMLDRDDPFEASAPLIAGFAAERALSDAELAALHPLILARLCLSAVHAARALARDPENTYIGVHVRPVWKLVRHMLGVHPDAAEASYRVAAGRAPGPQPPSPAEARIQRGAHLGPGLSLHYAEPLKICRGVMQHLHDEDGRRYLDLVNNVCHVGHSNPHVVRALARQAARLNTNTRYLHDEIARYSRRLAATMPDGLDVVYLVCSGSEANELALRLARAATGRQELLVVEHAYHGNSSGLVAASPYKFDGPGGRGAAAHVDMVPAPDVWRGTQRGKDACERYLESVHERLARRAPGAFLAESIMSCAGHVVPPDGYLRGAYAAVRAAGGLCVADEVQTGFGRVGSHFWAFEAHGVVPDIVTLGKPIGNGHPLAAVVTTRAIAEAFDNGMEYFNTFGGNPVSCAVGNAVLDVIEAEDLQARAARLGTRMRVGIEALDHPNVGGTRGLGLFLGLQLVSDRETLGPAPELARQLVESMKQEGVLVSTEGPEHDLLKIKPPLVLTEADVDHALAAFGRSLERAQPEASAR